MVRLDGVSSTNEYAAQLLAGENLPEGTVVYANHQTAGRGQGRNRWESEEGKNILMSMILYPEFLEIARQFQLSMCISLGITDFLAGLLPGHSIRIKWPNDIYAGSGKIGGILINVEIMGDSFSHVIAGAGVNINQLSFSKSVPNPVSVKMLSGQAHDPIVLARQMAESMLKRYTRLQQGDREGIVSAYHENLLGMGEWRDYIYRGKKIKAMIRGVNEYGRLLLSSGDQSLECDLKEISYLF
jgi:BirA family transcriptional regulator, biotin operon repressor / biotin---[acetyl-CoA-carboxylase] ligase